MNADNNERGGMINEDILAITDLVPTPFLLIQEKRLERNIRRIQDYANRHGFMVRPHVKAHKSLYIARMQMNAGAGGIAVAKAGEAEVMAQLGHVDITVAYPTIGAARTERLARLARTHPVRVAVDSEYLMAALAEAAREQGAVIGIHVMFDAGLHRCGVSDPEQVIGLAQYAKLRSGLRYDGIQLYLGHLYGDAAEDPQSFERINALWEPVYGKLCKAGLRPGAVSSGSTPSLWNTHLVRHVNEIRVGTAVLNDYFVLKFAHCQLKDCAARVVAAVVSDVVPGQVIIDAGSKSLSAKQLLRHENLELGYIVEYPEARIFRLHEEHGWVDVSRCKAPPPIGARLSIVPVNVALCMNLFDEFYLLMRDGTLRKEKINARGRYV